MTTPDLFGHLFYAFLFVGMILLAKQSAWGWIFRFVGELGWFFVGIALGLTSVIFWDFVFLLCEVYGYLQWRTKKQL